LPRSLQPDIFSIDTGGKFATGINKTSKTGTKFAAGAVDTGGKLPPVSLIPAAILPPVC
jgi:hypothetical protein